MFAKKTKEQLHREFIEYWNKEGKKILLRNAKEHGYYSLLKVFMAHQQLYFDKMLSNCLCSVTEDGNHFINICLWTVDSQYYNIFTSYTCFSSIRHFYMYFIFKFLLEEMRIKQITLDICLKEFDENVFKKHKIKRKIIEFIHTKIIYLFTNV